MQKNPIAVAIEDSVWAGTEGSLQVMLSRIANIEERVRASAGNLSAYQTPVKPEDLPYLFEAHGDIGVVSIKGPMTNATSYYDRYDKAATYPAIREALVHAATDSKVKVILLDIDSGGGAVSGVADTATLVRTINDNVKPVVAFSEGSMFSAAYWVGSGAGQVFASKSAGVGSIGVIGTHMEVSKMYEDMGIKATVIRSGKYKALANRFEPLTDEARAQIQEGMDAAYGVFVQHVADMRAVAYNVADTKMAQGREFYGEAALTAGLVDGIATFDSVMTALQQSVDNEQGFKHNSQNIS